MDALKNIVGEENFSDDEKIIALNSTDMSHLPAKAKCVVFPTTAEQVQKIIQFANRENIVVVPRGAGTGLAGGAVADDAIVLNLKKMDRILNLNKEGNRITVEPGIIIDRLNKELGKDNLFFPVRPSSHMIATIGGMIATDAVGDRGVLYGSTLANVEEFDVVTGNGDLITVFGNKKRIFSGKEGTTGIIVKAKLRIRNIPKEFSMTLHEFDNPEDLIEKVREVKEDVDVCAIEFMDSILHKLEGFKEDYLLIVEYIGLKGEVKDPAKLQEIWKERDKAYGLLASKGYKSIEDPVIPEENMAQFLRWLNDNKIPSFAHIGYGIIHPCIAPDKTDLLEEMYTVVRDLHGRVSGEHGIGIVKSRFLNDEEKSRHIRLKDIYDKNRILNRGKIVSE
ncbi:MAG: FAD-binding oxidoreductase [Candidatus Woesearchaeota archaeon]